MIDIAEVRKFIITCPALKDFAPVYVDYTDPEPVNYGIEDGGSMTLYSDITGRKTKQHNFSLFSRNHTAADNNRIEASQFNARFVRWIEQQNDNGIYPEVEEGVVIDEMWANRGLLVSYDPSTKTGIYNVQFFIKYRGKKNV